MTFERLDRAGDGEYSLERAVESVLDSYDEDRHGFVCLLVGILARLPKGECATILSSAHKTATFKPSAYE